MQFFWLLFRRPPVFFFFNNKRSLPIAWFTRKGTKNKRGYEDGIDCRLSCWLKEEKKEIACRRL